MAKIEIGFGAVVRDEYFAVLKRAHRPRIDVQVRIEFLQRDAQPAAFEKTADRRGRDSLPQGRNDSASDKDVLRHASLRKCLLLSALTRTVSARDREN